MELTLAFGLLASIALVSDGRNETHLSFVCLGNTLVMH